MYCNPTLKKLIKQAADIIIAFQSTEDSSQCPIFELYPFMEPGEKDSEVVSIIFKNINELNYQFLEPLSAYCVQKEISWTIRTEDNKDIVVDIR